VLRRRLTTRVAASLLAGGACLAVGAALVPRGVDMSTTAATAGAAPSTVAPGPGPAVDPSTTAGPTRETDASHAPGTVSPAPTTTVPASPLAAMVGAAQSPLPSPIVAHPAPAAITMDAIGVTAPIVAVGVQPDGQLEIPDEHHVGWYRLGASPGEPGATVLAAHVNWHHVDGPFARLRTLEIGSHVVLDLDDGSTRTYEVVERAQYDKTTLPADRIWTSEGPETLVLITCGGSFNPDIHRYRDNIVAYAVPVAAGPPTSTGP
jgi:hypothetical protein